MHRGVDRYPGSECAGGGGGDQHFGPLGMFSVCKSMMHHGVDCYPGWEYAGLRAAVVGINIMDL